MHFEVWSKGLVTQSVDCLVLGVFEDPVDRRPGDLDLLLLGSRRRGIGPPNPPAALRAGPREASAREPV